ncbi:SAM-dependent methyltransferase [Rubidibacter lacunae KORDI 51-2]|uniref:SAM-dependent methyltransferase n=1 Tax=Rubidibacter lacunae KORDI 51-2 TaxID=582515 RepID=U5DIU8_9CHRO|nr:class I SAM-dependent RNA methyltransferase [Rubidibacter lacunae]ERN41586.1 SAM-dependent methyltransferase [Rubidibacter lacunae KORDI 51-2]
MGTDAPTTEVNSAAIDLKQLRPGDWLTVTVDRFDSKYLGETRLQGKTLLVPGSLPGETIRGQVLRNWKRCLVLRPVEILTPDPRRVEPHCQHFALCAGCQFQHVDYAEQLVIKRSRLESFFEPEHPVQPLPLRGIIGSTHPYAYRNSIKVHGPGEPGFWQVKGIDMLRNRECPICVSEVEDSLKQQRESGFQEFVDRNVLNILIRATSIGDTYLGPEQPKADEVAWLTEAIAHPLTEESLQLVVPAHAFWQGSTPMLPRLIEEAVRPIRDFAPELLIETYCGMGLFGIMSAPFAARVIGVEDHPLAIEAARRNQTHLQLPNWEIIHDKTENRLEALLAEAPERTSLIVDPPRSGLPKKVLKQILRCPPQHLVYVSCNPESLARNLNKLCRETFQLQDIVGIDLFPQTKHLECVCVLQRRESWTRSPETSASAPATDTAEPVAETED